MRFTAYPQGHVKSHVASHNLDPDTGWASVTIGAGHARYQDLVPYAFRHWELDDAPWPLVGLRRRSR